MDARPDIAPPRTSPEATDRGRSPRRRLPLVAGVATVLVGLAAMGGLAVRSSGTAAPLLPPSGPTAQDGRLLAPSEPTAEDGRLPDGTTASPFDDSLPAITGLDPDLLAAVREAATALEADGRPLHVTSGWRSAEYQRWLQEDALRTYGSADEAAQWVGSPETSAHVTGDAVDLGPYPTAEWLSRRGAQFGLCQVYANEVWHFELRPEAPVEGCPEMLDDASDAPTS